MNRAKVDISAYQAKYRKDNKVRLSAQRRERYANEQKAIGKVVRPSKIERLDAEKAGRTEYQRNYYLCKKRVKEVKEVLAEEGLPRTVKKDKLYADQIDALYLRLSEINPLDVEYESIYGEINNLEIKLLNCKKR